VISAKSRKTIAVNVRFDKPSPPATVRTGGGADMPWDLLAAGAMAVVLIALSGVSGRPARLGFYRTSAGPIRAGETNATAHRSHR
jgi:hypothetical protein